MTVNINFHLCSLGTETQLVHSMLANLCPQRLNEPVSYRNYCSGFKAMKFLVRFLQRSPMFTLFTGVPFFPFYFSKEASRHMAEVYVRNRSDIGSDIDVFNTREAFFIPFSWTKSFSEHP